MGESRSASAGPASPEGARNANLPRASVFSFSLCCFCGALLCAVLGIAAFLADIPCAAAAQKWKGGEVKFIGAGELLRLIELSEVFAHGMGVAAILVAVLVLDGRRKRFVPRIAALAYGGGLAADLIKLAVPRIRPRAFPFDFAIWQSFTGALKPLVAAGFDYSSIQSFPSAHAATTVGLALGLSRIYPQGRWLFASFAALACLQRIVSGAHWPSDVLCGAAAGLLVASILTASRLAGRWFDRLELRIAR